MAKLSATERARLPNSAFAYVDSTGKRRLPIHDESHVRNALSRFRQVKFESQDARETARRRVLNAAKKHGIVPVGFIDAELNAAKKTAAAGKLVIELGRIETSSELEGELRRTLGDTELSLLRWSRSAGSYVTCDDDAVALPSPSADRIVTYVQGSGRPLMAIAHSPAALGTPEITEAVLAAVHLVTGKELLDEVDELGVATDGLPTGSVTFLLTDIEGSTGLLHDLGAEYASVLTDVRAVIRGAVLEAGGRQVEARADEFVAVFEDAEAAANAATQCHLRMAAHGWPANPVKIRIGLHTGDIELTESGYVGITVHIAARVMSAAHGGQTLLTAATARACGDDASLAALGSHQLRGILGATDLFQLDAPGLPVAFPAPAV